jgi:hypothetical protein
MPINTNTLEANLTTKINNTSGTTDAKEFLLLGKAIEAVTPSVTVQDVIDEGDTQITRVQTEGTTQVAAVQAAATGYATLSGSIFTGPVSGTSLSLSSNMSALDGTFTGNLTAVNAVLSGELQGPANLVIDPAAVGDNTGQVTIKGDLVVEGASTTVSSNTLDVADKNITIAAGAADAATANGAGLTVDGASANITYTSATDSWDFNKPITGTYKNLQPEQTTSSVTSSHVINMDEPLHLISLTGTTLFSFSNVAEGKITMIKMYAQASTVPSWSTDVKWPDDTEPTWADYDYWVINVIGHTSAITFASAQGYTV